LRLQIASCGSLQERMCTLADAGKTIGPLLLREFESGVGP